jgi:hypothetical protein
MQYKVPQNVDIEDKVVGPLSLRQFIILLVTVGIILVLYFLIPSVVKIFFWMLAIIIGAAGVAIAFTNYGGQNMEVFLMGAWKTFTTPRQRVWKKVPEPVQTMAAAEPEKIAKPKEKKSLEEQRDNLEKLASLVDAGGYVQVEKKDRVIGTVTKNELETGEVNDILEKSEAGSPVLEKTIASAKAPSREPLVSEQASVSPDKVFNYPRIEIKH